MHHLNSWIKRETNLMSLAFSFHCLMLNMFRMLIHPSSGACDLFVELFHGLYCSGSICVGVTLWFGWDVVAYLCRLKQCLSLCWCYGVVWWCGIRMQAEALLQPAYHRWQNGAFELQNGYLRLQHTLRTSNIFFTAKIVTCTCLTLRSMYAASVCLK